MATIAFIISIVKIVAEPDNKHRQIRIIKNILTAYVLVVLTFSIIDIPKYYYGNNMGIADSEFAEMTFADIKDKDSQGRETININGKWYVVTDTNEKLGSLSGDAKLSIVTNFGLYSTACVVENVSVLKKFSECQGFFKGYYAEAQFFRDSNGYIFPKGTTYDEYMAKKDTNLSIKGGD